VPHSRAQPFNLQFASLTNRFKKGNILKEHSHEKVCEIIPLNHRLGPIYKVRQHISNFLPLSVKKLCFFCWREIDLRTQFDGMLLRHGDKKCMKSYTVIKRSTVAKLQRIQFGTPKM
jgi:hypothetical protein